jgi:hypothetical protein
MIQANKLNAEKRTEFVADDDVVEEKVVDKVSGKEEIKRYSKSFTAKLIQSSMEIKACYNLLKQEMLSYERTKSTAWWNCESFHVNNRTIAKFVIHGGALYIFLALKPSDYANSKYQVEAACGKRNAHVPCMLCVKNSKQAKLAKDLISDMAMKLGLNVGANQKANYILPYESSEKLLKRGLIKEMDIKDEVDEKPIKGNLDGRRGN